MCMAPPVVCMDNCISCTDSDTCEKCNIGFVFTAGVNAAAPGSCEMDTTCAEGLFM